MDWRLYEKRVNINGNSLREENVNLTRENISNKICDSLSSKKILINDIERLLIVNSTDKANEKTFNTLPGEKVAIGDSVIWNKMHWLITEVDFDDEITMSGMMIQCNREIKWQNPITKEIISRWCFAERPYATGINEGNVVSVPDRMFRVKLPYDSETIQVDIGKRFVLETINNRQIVYELEMPDLNTNKFQDSDGGFIVWNLKYDNFIDTSRDSVELGICDYVEIEEPPLPPIDPDPTLLKCEIVGRDSIKIGGSARSYTAKFYKADGVTEINNNSVVAKWDISLPIGFEKYFTITPNANSISIKVLDNESLYGEKIVLHLSDGNNVYAQSELSIDLVVM